MTMFESNFAFFQLKIKADGSKTLQAELSAINTLFTKNEVTQGVRMWMPELHRCFRATDNVKVQSGGSVNQKRRAIVDVIYEARCDSTADKTFN